MPRAGVYTPAWAQGAWMNHPVWWKTSPMQLNSVELAHDHLRFAFARNSQKSVRFSMVPLLFSLSPSQNLSYIIQKATGFCLIPQSSSSISDKIAPVPGSARVFLCGFWSQQVSPFMFTHIYLPIHSPVLLPLICFYTFIHLVVFLFLIQHSWPSVVIRSPFVDSTIYGIDNFLEKKESITEHT